MRLLGRDRGYAAARRKFIWQQQLTFVLFQRYPRLARRFIRWTNARVLRKDYDVDIHFNPPYNPWDQRLCLVPDGDLLRAISDDTVAVVTDRIRTFTESGILLESGEEFAADVIVTATGSNIKLFGGRRALSPAKQMRMVGPRRKAFSDHTFGGRLAVAKAPR